MDPLAICVADPEAKDESRYVQLGEGSAGELLIVVYTERAEAFRLISARRATRKERRDYEDKVR